MRIALERDKHAPAPFRYRGAVYVPDASFEAEVTVTEDGEVDVSLGADPVSRAAAPADVAEKVRLIVRTVHRQAKADGEPPAWKINRWRGDK
jgi:hypothetical protein